MNRLICGLRSFWYWLIEPLILSQVRTDEGYRSGYPLVSVIIPTYNRCDLLLERALPSIQRQTYPNLEIIIAAHGCTDDTVERVGEIKDRRIRVLEVPRKRAYPESPRNHWLAGPVQPLNAALDACGGTWICRCDDDDIWTEDHVQVLLTNAKLGNFEFVSAGHSTDQGPVAPYRVGGVSIGGCQTWLYRSYLRAFKYNPDCWRKTWNAVNDTDLQDRFLKAGVRMGYLDRTVAYVLPRPGEKHVGLKAYTAKGEKTQRLFAFN